MILLYIYPKRVAQNVKDYLIVQLYQYLKKQYCCAVHFFVVFYKINI